MSSSRKLSLFVVIILILVSVFFLLSPVTEDGKHETGAQSGGQALSQPSEKGADGDTPAPSAVAVDQPSNSQQAVDEKVQENLDNLQSLLDDHDKNDETMELAVSMMKRTVPEKLAALNAFQWIGGPVSMKETVSAVTDSASEVAHRASDVLHHLIQEDLITEETSMTPELWQDLFSKLSEDERDPYLVLLTAYPVADCFPVLLNLMESKDESLRDSALEYASSIAEGIELANRDEAEKWFNAHLAKEAAQPKQDE